MAGTKGDAAVLRKQVLADLVANRSRGGTSTPTVGKRKATKISDVAQQRKTPK